MQESDKAQITSMLKHLQNAVQTAKNYMLEDDLNPEVIQIHITFVQQRIERLEKTIASINRRLKSEEIISPDEVEEAHELIRDLKIKTAQLVSVRKQQEKLEQAEALARSASESVRKGASSQMQVVLTKPPLPPLPIPKFSGDPMEYSNFATIFDETVHKNTALGASQKLVYLQSYVEGEAKHLIGKILITDENYETARQILKANFGHSSQTVSTLYDRLHAVQRTRNDPFAIRDTYNEVESILQMLEHSGVNVNSDSYLCHEVLKKWPFALVKQLVRSADEINLQAFRQELKKEVELQIQLTQATGYVPIQQTLRAKPYGDRPAKKTGVAATPSSTQSAGRSDSGGRTGVATGQKMTAESSAQKAGEVPMPEYTARCPFCQEQHVAERCEKFKTATQRKDKLGTKKCHKCFREVHTGTPCIRNRKCAYCPSWDHNRALCAVKYPDLDSKCLLTNEEEIGVDPPGLFITFTAVVSNPLTEDEAEMRILVDLACNRTALTENAARKIGIITKNRSTRPTKGMGGRVVEPISEESVEILLHAANNEMIKISTRLTKKIVDDVPAPDLKKFRQRYPAFEQCHIPPSGQGQPVDVIVGSDRLLRILELDKSLAVSESCQLLATKFGWLIMMEQHGAQSAENDLFNFFTKADDIIKFMWDLDLVGMKSLSEPDTEFEEKALQVFYDSIKYVDGRYEIRWPWRTTPPNLNENYGLAIGRLKTLLKKLQEQPKLLQAYHAIIQEQLVEGVLEDVPRNGKSGPVIHYIPHHAVIVLEKSTPVRIVMDAAASTGRTKSINDNMLKGTKWLGNTVGSLLRFRKFRKAITADIRHAFHQINIAPPDRDAVRFLWVHDPMKPPQNENLRTLRFCRVAFGIVASPFLLYATIQYHLRKQNSRFAGDIGREMYADNLLISLSQQTDEVEFYHETKEIFRTMSMDMTKWKSNSCRLMQVVPQADKLQEEEISVLGLAWCSQNDTLGLRPPKISHLEKSLPTKRIVLKTMASIFDPLGWSAPFVLQIRLFLRKLWQEQKSWDATLSEENLQIWRQLKQQIQDLPTMIIQRLYFKEECDEEKYTYEIHTFVDASSEAIGVVSYLRQISESTSAVAFLMAKTRLAPAAKMSIPRLEFYAMVIGVRMQKYIVESFNLQNCPKSYIWGDSKCVLAWISSNKLLPVAVEKKLVEIRNSGVHEFRYVPTAINPADVASRGAALEEIKESSWLSGPVWLKKEADWPAKADVSSESIEILEQEKKVLFIQGENKVEINAPFSLDHTKFSEWKVLLRRTAYCIWLLHRCLRKNLLKIRTPIDYNTARMLWLRWDQRRNGAEKLEIIKKIKHFKGVQVFIDDFGVARCRSRLQHAHLPWSAVEPIILVKGSHITELIVLDIHRRNYHVGTAQTLATLRKNYWLIHGRREVYRIINRRCLKCREAKAKPFAAPDIAPLPQFRITQTSHPFENVGIDIFGPLSILTRRREGQESEKRWILLLTCLVIRAVHLEVIEGVDTIDIICAIKRFTARRGTPALILSDNAKQFHLIDGCLKELWREFKEDDRSNRYFAEQNITWKFTPEHAPWMGGAYERLVQVTKNSLKKTYGEQELTELEFNTTIIEIEGVMNNRPITYVDNEISTPLLTPNHFLRAIFPAIPIDVNQRQQQILSTKERVLQYWKAAEESLNVYWKIWSDQYLLALREIRSKTAAQRIQPAVGQVVLMIDPSYRRGYWRVGRIEKLIPSGDQIVRSAQVRFPAGSVMIRPVTKLVPIEFLDYLPDECDSSSLVVSGEDADTSSADPSEIDAEAAPVVLFQWSCNTAKKKR